MNVLFIVSRHSENSKNSALQKDLSDEFARQGHKVFVVTMLERKEQRETSYKDENGYKVLRVRTWNYFDITNKIEKGITAMTIPFLFFRAIKKKIGKKEKIDLAYTHTPFISSYYLVRKLKKYYKCKAILNLWDIFPQNAKDIGIIKNKFLLYFFERREKKMYQIFDKIGCMSVGNIEYMQKHNIKIDKNKFFLLKNWAKLENGILMDKKEETRKKYGFKKQDFICVFGGNMGKPQKLENILLLAEKIKERDIKILLIGKGSEQKKLKKIKEEKKLLNVIFFDFIPREDYEIFIGVCDVGLVSLDKRFTVPNFPSKTTDYFKLGLPILASLDNCSKNDYGKFLQDEVKAGLFAEAENTNELYRKLLELYQNRELKEIMGKNGRKYYEENLGVEKAYNTIMSAILD